MMRCARFERLAGLALGAGARALPTGDGAFVAQHQGQRFQLQSLYEVAAWLASVAPAAAPAASVAVLRNRKFNKAMKAARKEAKRTGERP
jgi:hypothetical protein